MKQVKRNAFWAANGYENMGSMYAWVAINEEVRKVCFTGWANHTKDGETIILSTDWEYNAKGRKNANYKAARMAIDLVTKNGYGLQMVPAYMKNLEAMLSGEDTSADMEGVLPVLLDCTLEQRGKDWYAIHGEELPPPEQWRPRKPVRMSRDEARQLMAEYYREHRTELPADIVEHREGILDRIVEGLPVSEAFKV